MATAIDQRHFDAAALARMMRETMKLMESHQ
jgi:hypothetical protein